MRYHEFYKDEIGMFILLSRMSLLRGGIQIGSKTVPDPQKHCRDEQINKKPGKGVKQAVEFLKPAWKF